MSECHKIVVLDAISIPEEFAFPKPAFACDMVFYKTTSYEEIVDRCKDAFIIATNKCKLDKNILDKLPKVKLICELATGYNNIDIDYCKEKGIAVTNIQGYSTNSVAEHAIAMMLTLARSFMKTRDAMKDGVWVNAPSFCLMPGGSISDLNNKTLTIIGNGAIGKRIAEIAKVFNMKVLKAEHRGVSNVREGYTEFTHALKEADFISCNCPLNEKTLNLITKDEIALMKKSVIIINNARGGVVNENDLVNALLNEDIYGAASDVASIEPLPQDHVFTKVLKHDRFLLTPHQAWMSYDCLTELLRQFKENMDDFVLGKSTRRIV